MTEIIDSYNGRIFREPPLLWRSLARLFTGDTSSAAADAEGIAQTAQYVENLRNEAKARIAEVSAYAATLEPYLEEGSGYWWVALAHEDPRFGDVLDELRTVVSNVKDVERYHAQADAKLLSADDVRQLADEFIAAYPRWKTVVEAVGGHEAFVGESRSAIASVKPFPGYGAFDRRETATAHGADRPGPSAPSLRMGEPVPDPEWHEVYDSALALYRRYETGTASRDMFVGWPERVQRLREIYDHYVSLLGAVPDFVWTRLFRDALLIPSSPSYVGVTELLTADTLQERRAMVEDVVRTTGADVDLLRLAVEVDAVSETTVPVGG